MPKPQPRLIDFVSRFWFHICLSMLFLLALPGLVFFAMNVIGGESELNVYLLNRLNLTYRIPFGWWASLLILLVPLAIILLYFLKLKRKPLSVPSTFLWKKSIEDLHVNALFQWLRRNLLLLLQLLAVLVMIYSIMDLKLYGQKANSRHFVIVIDNSASMGATDVLPTRLEWAKREALKEIDAANDGDVGMVVKFNSSAEIVQSFTSNLNLLRQAVQSVQQTQRTTRIEEALSLIDSLANPSRSADDNSVKPADQTPGKERTYVAAEGIATSVHLYSDGRFPDAPDFALGNLNLQFHLAGKPGAENTDNVAIVNFNAVRDEQDPSKVQAFVRILNFRPNPVQARLQLEIQENGKLRSIQEKPVVADPRRINKVQEPGKEETIIRDMPGESAIVFEVGDVDDRSITTLHAKLLGIKDNLAVDDEAWLVSGVVRKARVLLVGPNNEILNAFFGDKATREVAQVTRMTPAELTGDAYRNAARDGAYDLVIFDRCGPATEEDMPRSNTFFIGYPPPPWKLSSLEKVTNPQLKGWVARHPALRYLVALHEIGIADAFVLNNLPPRTPKLMEIDGNRGILVALSRQLFTDLVMTFPILDDHSKWNTNWPLLPSFPLFLRNVIYTYGNIEDGASEETLQPGQVKTLRPDVKVNEIEVTEPSGKDVVLESGSRAAFSYGQTDQLGLYKVSWKDAWRRSFAVNLLDPSESAIEPRSAVQIGAVAVTAATETKQAFELWKWFVLCAVGLILVEWYVYNKRIFI